MAEHTADVIWHRREAPFTDNRYSRAHIWEFDGGVTVAASSSPQVIPLPLSVAEAVDPEEAFVASLSSCHMLWFLSIAAKRGFVVEGYRDRAVGVMGRDPSGSQAMTIVTLRPETEFVSSTRPTPEEMLAMHYEAHSKCFIANSVKSEIRCEPVGQEVL
ncbi:MAG: organic hydroperoxide reductase OsmC/OhrA [Rhodothermales bacterium]|jgi:organic hydroperoxide reductase OsmC/OhrA